MTYNYKEENTMTKSFVERLTQEQIHSFVDELYPKKQGFTYSSHLCPKDSHGGPCICICVNNSKNGFYHIFRLEEFSAQIFDPNKWLNYLKKIFGDEYVKSFIENCLSVFDDNDEH